MDDNQLKREDISVTNCFVRLHGDFESGKTLFKYALFVLYWTNTKTEEANLDTIALTGPIRVEHDGTVIATGQQWFFGAVDDWNGYLSKKLALEGVVCTGDAYQDVPASRLIGWDQWFAQGGK